MSKTVTWYEGDSRSLANNIAEKLIVESMIDAKAGEADVFTKPQLTSMISSVIEEYIGK